MDAEQFEVEAERLLCEAERAYGGIWINHREGMLVVGRILHQYILATVSAGDGQPREFRTRHGYTRRQAVLKASERLGMRRDQTLYIVATAMTGDLLSGGEYGRLGFSIVREFTRLVERVGLGGNRNASRQDSSLQETWRILPGMEDKAKRLFATAVAETWGQDRAREEVCKLAGKRGVRPDLRKSLTKRATEQAESVGKQMSKASPGDFARVVVGMVMAHEDPWQVAQRLIAELQRIPRPRMRAV
jgi:hypothetical protein